MKMYCRKVVVAVVLMALNFSLGLAQNSKVKHSVERGETLSSIAKRYSTTEAKIIELNPDAGQFIYVGMELVLPNAENESGEKLDVNDTNANVFSDLQANSVEGNIAESNSKEALSYLRLLYQSKAEIYGFDYGLDLGKYVTCRFFGRCNCKFGGDDVSIGKFGLAVGAKHRMMLGEACLISFELAPYVALGSIGQPKIVGIQEAEDKTSFEYGMFGNITLGVKICNTSKGNSTFLTAGYEVDAGRFKTKSIFKYGYFSIGLITIVGN